MEDENIRKTLDTIIVKIDKVQETLDKHTESLGLIVGLVAGPMPNAINQIEKAVGKEPTDFSKYIRAGATVP